MELVYGHPEPETVENYSVYVQDLQENIQRTYEFARRHLDMSFEVMEKRYNSDSTAGAFDIGDLVCLLTLVIKREIV